jgi:hypothetical protein
MQAPRAPVEKLKSWRRKTKMCAPHNADENPKKKGSTAL